MTWLAFLIAFAIFLPLIVYFGWWAVGGIVAFLAVMLPGFISHSRSRPC